MDQDIHIQGVMKFLLSTDMHGDFGWVYRGFRLVCLWYAYRELGHTQLLHVSVHDAGNVKDVKPNTSATGRRAGRDCLHSPGDDAEQHGRRISLVRGKRKGCRAPWPWVMQWA